MCSGIMTDCTFEDAQRLHGKEGVSMEDVLTLHEDFEQSWGDFLSKR